MDLVVPPPLPRSPFLGLAIAAMAATLTFPAVSTPMVAAVDPVVTETDTWAWCGVDPDLPDAEPSVRSMAEVAGIDATFGPCIQPGPDYSPAEPGTRYAPPDVYQRLVELNAEYGMQTVVYDARLWDEDPAVRTAAIDGWLPYVEHIAGWDLGDEFAPEGEEWPILVARWQTVLADATVRTGVDPFVNHLHWGLEAALADLPGSDRRTSFTRYFDDKGVHVAVEYADRVENLLCGVNAFTHQIFFPSAESIRSDMAVLRAAGCDTFLVFGGHRVFGTDAFGDRSLTNPDGTPTDWAYAVSDGATVVDERGPAYVPVTSTRLLDTRTDGGLRAPASTTRLRVAGRAGLPSDVSSVVLAVTVTEPAGGGFVTVWPCDEPRPNAAALTHGPGRTVLNLVMVHPDGEGDVCLFTQSAAHLVVDVNGYQPTGSRIDTVTSARLLETRVGPGLTTVDGVAAGSGLRPAGTVTELPVTGRGGVSATATGLIANLTVTEPTAPGFVTVFPCGEGIPTAANLTYDAGATVSNAVLTGIGSGGTVCLYNSSDAHLVVDVTGYVEPTAPYDPVTPARLLDTRTGSLRPAVGSTTSVAVAGRGGLPTDAAVAVLNVTAVAPSGGGFLTAFPCGAQRPLAATLTFGPGETRSALSVVPPGIGGRVCIYSSAATQLVVDVTGFHQSR